MRPVWKRALAFTLALAVAFLSVDGAAPALATLLSGTPAVETEAEPETEGSATLQSDEDEYDGGVVYVGENGDLGQVFAEVTASSVTVELTADVTLTQTATVAEGKSFTLDLNDHTVTVFSQETPNDEGEQGYMDGIQVYGDLTVQGPGSMVSETDHTGILSVDGGYAEVRDVEMTASGYNCTCASVSDLGSLTMERVELHALGDSVCYGAAAFSGGVLRMTDSSIDFNLGGILCWGKTITDEESDEESEESYGADEAYLFLSNVSVQGKGIALLLSDTAVDLRDGCSIRAACPDDADEYTQTIAVSANRGSVTISGNSVVQTDGGEYPAIGLYLYDSSAGIRGGSQVLVSGETAVGIEKYGGGVVDLEDTWIVTEGDAASGVRMLKGYSATNADNSHLWLGGATNISAQGTESAVGVELDHCDGYQTGSVVIRANGPDATGLIVNDSSWSCNSTQARIEAGTEDSEKAVAVQVNVQPETAPSLVWVYGDASASASAPDNAFAVLVELPEEEAEDHTIYAEIQPDPGTFFGRVCALRDGVEAADSGAISIIGGRYSVAPHRAYLPAPYEVQDAVDPSDGALYEVKARNAALVVSNGERTEYATLLEAWDAAQSGDTVRLYGHVDLGENAPLTLPAGKTLTLEMNGYSLIGDGEQARADGSVLLVEGDLTIEAARTESGAAPGDALNHGGTITLGNSTNTAGGIVVRGTESRDAVLTMHGGTVRGNEGRVGGIEARYADVTLDGTIVSGNTGTDTGGIEAVASTLRSPLPSDRAATQVTGNTATAPGGTGGILVSGLDDVDQPSFLEAEYILISENTGLDVGGLEADTSVVHMDSGMVLDNAGGATGGILLHNSKTGLGGREDIPMVVTGNTGGLIGGVAVVRGVPDDVSELTVNSRVSIIGNMGNVPVDPETLEADDSGSVELDLALDASGTPVPVTPVTPYQESGNMNIGVSIIQVDDTGTETPENGVKLFTLTDVGDVYALTGTVTTPGAPAMLSSDDEVGYLWPDLCYGPGYAVEQAEDGSLAITGPGYEPSVEGDYTGKTVILHSNDVHGAIMGYSYIAALRTEFEEHGASVILADAGDFSQGDPNVSLTKGADAITMMNAAGYDVATLGNHEFDYGYGQLMDDLADAEFSVICADVYQDGSTILPPTWTYESASGLKIGFFGMETPETQTKVNPGLIQGIRFVSNTGADRTALYTCAQEQIDALRAEGADIVIALAHLGVDAESAPDGHRSVDLYHNTEGIDLILDGHSHTVMTEGEDGEPVQSTGTKFEYVGVVVIDDESKAIEDHYLLPTEGMAQDAAVAAQAQAIIDRVNAEYGEVFARSEVALNGERASVRTKETNLGDLITDAMVWKVLKEDGAVTVDDDHVVGINNGGGIRADIQAGDITRKDLNTVLPFGNTLAVVYVTGAELLEALEASTYCTPEEIGGYPQTFGIGFTLDTTKPYDQGEAYPDSTYYAPASIQRVTITAVNGEPFGMDETYAVVTNNFCAAGGDTYYAFHAASEQFDTGIVLDEAVVEYITEALGGVISRETYETPRGDQTILTTEDPGTTPGTGPSESGGTSQGCYVATSVYGSYDCPEVWTLRRYRDEVLADTWYGRLFIRAYYALSPTAVELFGESAWFQDFFRTRLDQMVSALHAEGFADTPYQDTDW